MTPPVQDPLDAANWTIVTPSFGGDLEQFSLLNESIVRMAPSDIEHLVITDRDDLELFRPLVHDRMRLVTKEDVLPGRVRRLSRSKQVWLSTAFPPIRGWIAQQMVKIQVAATNVRPYLLFADSDVVFLRPFEVDRFCRDGAIGLSRVRYESDDLAAWRRSSAHLLRIEPAAERESINYVSNLIPWRRDVAQAMVDRIESTHRTSWTTSVALRPHFSEYTLYGMYCDEFAGRHAAGHFSWDDPILNLNWEPVMSDDDLTRRISRTTDVQVGAMFHSKSDFDRHALRAAVTSFWDDLPDARPGLHES